MKKEIIKFLQKKVVEYTKLLVIETNKEESFENQIDDIIAIKEAGKSYDATKLKELIKLSDLADSTYDIIDDKKWAIEEVIKEIKGEK